MTSPRKTWLYFGKKCLDIPSSEAHNCYMRLTETTQVRKLANGFVAVYEPGKVATIVRPGNEQTLWACSWLINTGWNEDGEEVIQECGSACVGMDNGFACEDGHRHFDYGTFEYFDADEIAGMANAHVPFPANSRAMSGASL